MEFLRHEKNNIVYFTSPLFDSHGVRHFFAARRGGVSEGDFDSLNCSLGRKSRNGVNDTPKNVFLNLSMGLEILGKGSDTLCLMNQIHSTTIRHADVSADFAANKPCDGIFAGQGDKASTLCVKTADCVPVLIYDLKNKAACAIHAGWRGTCGNICSNAIRQLKEVYGNGEYIAAIGPCIGACCYEVSENVYLEATKTAKAFGISQEQIKKCFPKQYISSESNEKKYRAELASLNKLFLLNEGLEEKNISISGLCTCCFCDEHGAVFFSHRANGGFSGTQMSMISVD